MTHTKKQNEQTIELQRQQNDELVSLKHDLDVKIDNLKRDLVSRNQEFASL